MNTASRYSVSCHRPGLLQPRDGFGPNPVGRLLHLWVWVWRCVYLKMPQNIQKLFVESGLRVDHLTRSQISTFLPRPMTTPVKNVQICRVLCSFVNLCCSFWGLVCTTIAFCVVGCMCLHVLCNFCYFATVMSWDLAFPGPAVSTFRSWKLWVFFKSCNNKLMLSHFPCVYWTTGASHSYLLLGNRCEEVNLCCHVCAVALQGLNSTTNRSTRRCWSLLFTKGALWCHVGGGGFAAREVRGWRRHFLSQLHSGLDLLPSQSSKSRFGLKSWNRTRFRVTRQVFLKLHFAWKLAKLASSAQSICDLCSWIIVQHCQSLLRMMNLQISLISRSLDFNTS